MVQRIVTMDLKKADQLKVATNTAKWESHPITRIENMEVLLLLVLLRMTEEDKQVKIENVQQAFRAMRPWKIAWTIGKRQWNGLETNIATR